MDFSWTSEQHRVHDGVVELARTELNDGAGERDAHGRFDRAIWRRCGEERLQGLPVPEEEGGRGLDPTTTAVALEALGYGCLDGGLGFAIGAHLLSCVLPVWKHGSASQRKRWLEPLCDGTLVAVNGMTEETSGSDAFAMATTARRDGARFVLNGKKVFASNGPVADLALVYAATDPSRGFHGGVTAFLIETGAPGFQVGPPVEKMGLRTCLMGELVLEDVVADEEAVLGGVGAGGYVFADAMNWERTGLSAWHAGTMRRLTEQAVSWARARRSGGRPILEHQAVAHRLADMTARLEAARLLTYRAAQSLERGGTAARDAAMAKLVVSESLVRTALDAVQVFGGYGFTAERGIERALRDAVPATLHSGTSEIQRNILAGWLEGEPAPGPSPSRKTDCQ